MNIKTDQILDHQIPFRKGFLFQKIGIILIVLGSGANLLLYTVYYIESSGILITTPNPTGNIPSTPLMKNIFLYFVTLNTVLIISWVFIKNLKKQNS